MWISVAYLGVSGGWGPKSERDGRCLICSLPSLCPLLVSLELSHPPASCSHVEAVRKQRQFVPSSAHLSVQLLFIQGSETGQDRVESVLCSGVWNWPPCTWPALSPPLSCSYTSW